VAGWGCVAKADIPEGTVLFRIPRSACFIATKDGDNHHHHDHDDDDSYNDPTTKDTQKDLALHLLKHKHSTAWAPFLNLLTPQSLPWTWNEALRDCLRGTELEQVVQNKIRRIQAEYEDILHSWDTQTEKRECITYRDYLDATSIVASHANPWFGVSIVPFNTTLNWGKDVNVEFDLEEIHPDHDDNHHSQEVVVGRAVRHITKGSELFQQYGESVAEVVYRCGFAPKFDEHASSDSLSLFIGDIVRVMEKLSSPEMNDNNSSSLVNENPTKIGIPTSSIITHLPARIDVLKKSGAIDTSPWDGMDECLSAELSSPSSVFIKSIQTGNAGKHSKDFALRLRKRQRDEVDSEQDDISYEERSSYDDGGISKLIGICLVLAADDETWKRTSTAVDNIIPDNAEQNEDGYQSESDEACPSSEEENETESRSDDITASVLLASLGNLTQKQSTKLQQRSLDVGMGGHDPWRALLLELSNMTNSKKTLKWEIALEAANLVVQERLDRLMGGEESCHRIKTTCPEENVALGTTQALQLVERSLRFHVH
jgi:hypothetical protein